MGKKINKHRKLYIALLIGIITGLIFSTTRISNASIPTETPVDQSNFELVALYWTIGVVGGCIALTLTYVSWRKYRAHKKKSKKETNS